MTDLHHYPTYTSLLRLDPADVDRLATEPTNGCARCGTTRSRHQHQRHPWATPTVWMRKLRILARHHRDRRGPR